VPITFDPAKCEKTLVERGLDFRRAKEVFEGVHLTRQDDRCDYGEHRFITAGRLDKRIVILILDASWPCATRHIDEEG
jgi:uncharacterized protein